MSDGPFRDLASYGSGAPTDDELAGYDLNDFGNAMRLIRLAGGTIDADYDVDTTRCTLLFLFGLGWIGFNGRFWDRKFGEELARRLAHKTARKIRGLCAAIISDKKLPPKEAYKFADSCGSAGATSAMLKQAQSYLTVELEAFDEDPLVINCQNGTLKIQREPGDGWSAKLHPHDPADRITRLANAEYDPEAKAVEFLRVLHESLPIEAERAYFHRACGYGATGCIHEQAFFLVQGRGRDGKSTLLDACREVLGTYGAAANPLTFMEGGQQTGSGPTPDLVRLAGDTRFCVLSEPKRGVPWNEGLLKSWTSGSPITARDLNAKNIEFRPKPKLFFEMNGFPPARGDDDGIWRRMQSPQFRVQVPEDQVDKELGQRIQAKERAGVLNWLIAGVGDWLSHGLSMPPSLKGVIEDYRKSSSPMGDWLNDRCVHGAPAVDPDDPSKPARTLVKHLYADLKEWCDLQGIDKHPSARSFGDFLRDRQIGLKGKNRDGNKYRAPIRLKTPAELDRDQKAVEAAAGIGSPDAGGASVETAFSGARDWPEGDGQ